VVFFVWLQLKIYLQLARININSYKYFTCENDDKATNLEELAENDVAEQYYSGSCQLVHPTRVHKVNKPKGNLFL